MKIKGVFTNSFSVELYEIKSGKFVVIQDVIDGLTKTSEEMDLSTALYLFDITLQKLEGQ